MAQPSHRNESTKPDDNGKAVLDKTKNLAERGVAATQDTMERVADTAHEAGEKAKAAGAQMLDETKSAVGQGLATAAETGRRTADALGAATREVRKAETDLAEFWLSLGREQLQHNIEIMKRMTAVRDMRELVELQSEFVRVSLSRANLAFTRQIGLAGRMFASGTQVVQRRA